MRTNAPAPRLSERNHEGAAVRSPQGQAQLLRRVASFMLFEDTFYEKGSDTAAEIAALCEAVPLSAISAVAITAREDFKLRHAPLFLVAQMDRIAHEQRAADLYSRYSSDGILAATVERVVQRPDELTELLSIIQKENGGRPLKKVLSAQVKKGLARAFRKFSAFQLAKWNRDNAIKLRDVMFLVHPKPHVSAKSNTIPAPRGQKGHVRRDVEGQGYDWAQLAAGSLPTPDTWETELSAGEDKKETWERLLREDKLGDMATVMNLRNMAAAGVTPGLVQERLSKIGDRTKLLPFRFISAAKAAPAFAQEISDAMLRAIPAGEPLLGRTAILVDISPSMNDALSEKSQMTREEAAAGLAVLVREVCPDVAVFSFSNQLRVVANYRGLPLIKALHESQESNGTMLRSALNTLFYLERWDRVIVVTDEQSQDGVAPCPDGVKGYLMNVAPYRPGLDTAGGWKRISGFSERLIDWIRYEEAQV